MTSADTERTRLLADRQRHVDELTVLNDLARRLTTLRDPREVLDEVAAQARRLLPVDVAYLMLVRPDGTLRTEAVSGAYGTALRGIVVERGTGLAGEVLRTGRPWTSEDYLGDPGFRHVESIDLAASGERLGGVLAIPLHIGDDTIGVLCAAARERRCFGEHEIELSSRLAAHAAVAIANARLLEQYREAVRELEQTNASLRRAVASRQEINDLRERLSRLLLDGARFHDLVRELRRSAPATVAVFGSDGALLDGDTGATIEGLTGRTHDDIAADPATHLRLDGPHGTTLVTKTGSTPDRGGCVVAVATDPEQADHLVGLLAVGATSLALYAASQRLVSEAELRTRGELLGALLSSDIPAATILRRAATARLEVEHVTAVAVVDLGGGNAATTGGLGRRLVDDLGGWSAEHSGVAVGLFAGATADAVRSAVARLAGPRPPTTIGIASSEPGVTALRRAIEVAHQTVTVLKALGREQDCALAAELGPYRALFSAAGRGEIRAMVEYAVGPLIEHDRRYRSDLARTLSTFLAASQNHTRAAAGLHVHPNTLYRRLERVTALLGEGWRTAPRTLEVQLALHLRELMATL